jgi:cytochrome c5
MTTIALSVGLQLAALAQQSAKAAPDNAKNTKQEITLPEMTTKLPDGPHRDVVENRCELCHTARYITMQPRFSQAVWEKEVKKMVNAYKAPISDAEQAQIVEYLVAIKGAPEKNNSGVSIRDTAVQASSNHH